MPADRYDILVLGSGESGKYLAWSPAPDGGEGFDAIQRTAANLDYWDGEP